MKKTLTIASLLLVIVSPSLGQDEQPKARMVRPPFVRGDALHAIQEVALDFKEHVTDPADRVAITVCSKKKLRRALMQASASPFLLQEFLEHYGINARRILFLRSEECLVRDASTVVTEFWLIPKGAAPPASAESITAEEAAMYKPPTQSQDDEQLQRPMNCEELLARLDHAIIDWMDLKGTYFILIARLGNGERDRKLNLARMRYVEEYLTKKKVQYIFAEGSRVNGLGRVEVYVGGRLAFSAPTKKGVIRLCFGNTG